MGYANTFYSYADNRQQFDNNGNVTVASNSGLLDEVDNVVHLDRTLPTRSRRRSGVVGYQFRETDYIGDQPIGQYVIADGHTVNVMSDMRNARSCTTCMSGLTIISGRT